ncbi:hypothetical protein ACFL67_01655 [candidate division KSB1 bacterium]
MRDHRNEDPGLQYFGKLSAAATHDLSNVIAIIREYSGLMNDLLAPLQPGQPVDIEKFKNIADKINAQTIRGNTILKRFNRFSHTTDSPRKLVNLSEILQDVSDLHYRFASLLSIEITVEFTDEPVEMETDPFMLMLACGKCLDICLSSNNRNGRIRIGCDVEKGTIRLFFKTDDSVIDDDFENKVISVREYVEPIDGNVEIESNDELEISIHIPFPG